MIYKRPQFGRQSIEIAEYLGQEDPALGHRFLTAVELTLARLETNPHMGRPWRSQRVEHKSLRTWRVEGFPNHLIFYRPSVDGIEAVYMIHGARDFGRAARD